MNDSFERRVRAAAVAGWWTLLAAVIFLSAVWLIFVSMMSGPPGQFERLWAPIPREEIFSITLWLVGIFKLFLWAWAMVALWLTLWARQLRKSASGM